MKGLDMGMKKTPPPASPVYFFGFIGAAVYYCKKAENPKQKAMGVLKAFAWPAFLVYDVLRSLHRQ